MGNSNSQVVGKSRSQAHPSLVSSQSVSCGSNSCSSSLSANRPRSPNFKRDSDASVLGPVDITKPAATDNSSSRFKDKYYKRFDLNKAFLHKNKVSLPDNTNVEDLEKKFETEVTEKEEQERYPVLFKYSGDAREVFVCGSFNNWQPLRMNKSNHEFVTIIDVPEGMHEYKFVADGKWTLDPSPTAQTVETKIGIPKHSHTATANLISHKVTNNVINVHKDDFDADHALTMDHECVRRKMEQESHAMRHLNQVFPSEYGQVMPSAQAFEHVGVNGKKHVPPSLPPHLLQVILNKDTPLSCEPTLLPEPNHVMINHLYALSIKDNVMVLSSTQRYRKKFVTTLLYKPMPEG